MVSKSASARARDAARSVPSTPGTVQVLLHWQDRHQKLHGRLPAMRDRDHLAAFYLAEECCFELPQAIQIVDRLFDGMYGVLPGRDLVEQLTSYIETYVDWRQDGNEPRAAIVPTSYLVRRNLAWWREVWEAHKNPPVTWEHKPGDPVFDKPFSKVSRHWEKRYRAAYGADAPEADVQSLGQLLRRTHGDGELIVRMIDRAFATRHLVNAGLLESTVTFGNWWNTIVSAPPRAKTVPLSATERRSLERMARRRSVRMAGGAS